MRHSMFDELEHRLDRIDHGLARSGRNKAALQHELHRAMGLLHSELFRSGSGRVSGVGGRLHDSFHMLARRVDRAQTALQLREVLRDIRHFTSTAASFAQTNVLEARLQELEGQVQSSIQSVDDGGAIDETVVTLESLAKKRILFAIMPFSDEFSDVWLGGIKRAASGTGLVPVRIDMITKTSEITDDIVKVIRMAEVVVVDVTGNNANVMFEFGFALALKKPHVVISQSTEYLTFDIKNLRTVIYRNCWQGVETLHKDLQTYIKGATSVKATKKAKSKAKSQADG